MDGITGGDRPANAINNFSSETVVILLCLVVALTLLVIVFSVYYFVTLKDYKKLKESTQINLTEEEQKLIYNYRKLSPNDKITISENLNNLNEVDNYPKE